MRTSEKVEDGLAAPDADASKFYRGVWRWHFYAGIFAIPFLLVLSVTGTIYLFKPQLDSLMYRNLMFVSPRTKTVSADDQLSAVDAAFPDATIKAYSPAPALDRSSKFDITAGDKRNLFVFVDPHDARVLGSYDADRNLQNYAVLLHGELMIGRVGDTLVELAACWALVLMITGLYMWFPRGGSGIRGTLLPRLLTKSKRIFWRDIHATVGFYGSLIVIFMILTGLFWTGFWGEKFASVWSDFPPQKDAGSVNSTVLTGSLNTTSDKKVAWAAEQMPMPESQHGAHDHSKMMAAALQNGSLISKGIDLNTVENIAVQNKLIEGYSIIFPQKENGVFTISAPLGDPYRQRTIHVDRFSGKILADVGWQDYATVPRAVTIGISLHEGLVFGIWNQILMLFAALTVFILAVSGTIMWWRRRPSGQLGAPPMPENLRIWKTAVIVIALLGIAFPLVGISLIAVLLLDYLVISRIPLLQRIFL